MSEPQEASMEESDSLPTTSGQRSSIQSSRLPTTPTKRTAFSELMSPKHKRPKSNTTSTTVTKQMPRDVRSGLLTYILNPQSFPPDVVIHHTEHSVLIRDLYPKATIHLLLLPRNQSSTYLHPHEAFADHTFLSLIRAELPHALHLAASELSRRLSHFSSSDRVRNEALSATEPPSTLPPGRDYASELRIGVHAHPSMSNLHIHIISRDMHSPALKHRKHYNSFTTDFFIPIADMPLPEDDQRRSTRHQNANLKEHDFICWRCGQNFKNRFVELKNHLDEEFETWKRE